MGAVYSQLALSERRKIETWWHAKVPLREIARVPKRHTSRMFREIKRNFWADDAFPKKYAGCFGHAAHLQTDKRRFAHWEGDLVLFKQKLGQSNVTSRVEWVSRFMVLPKTPNKRTKPVMGKIIKTVCDLPPSGAEIHHLRP